MRILIPKRSQPRSNPSVSSGQREIELIDVHLPVPKLQARQFGLFTLPIDFNTNNWEVNFATLGLSSGAILILIDTILLSLSVVGVFPPAS